MTRRLSSNPLVAMISVTLILLSFFGQRLIVCESASGHYAIEGRAQQDACHTRAAEEEPCQTTVASEEQTCQDTRLAGDELTAQTLKRATADHELTVALLPSLILTPQIADVGRVASWETSDTPPPRVSFITSTVLQI